MNLRTKIAAAMLGLTGLAAIAAGCGGREAVPTPTPTPAVSPFSEEYCAELKRELVAQFGDYIVINDFVDGGERIFLMAIQIEPPKVNLSSPEQPKVVNFYDITAVITTSMIQGDYGLDVDVVQKVMDATFTYKGKTYTRSYAVHYKEVIGNSQRVAFGPLQCFNFPQKAGYHNGPESFNSPEKAYARTLERQKSAMVGMRAKERF